MGAVRWLIALTVAAAAWVFLAPPWLGGMVTYVAVRGHSMEPTLDAGDLVVLARSGSYDIGDVIAYRVASMNGATLIHRIVAIEDGRYVTKGDNNDFIDEYRPTPREALGKRVVRMPGGASVTGALRSPLGVGALMSVVGASLYLGMFGNAGLHRMRGR